MNILFDIHCHAMSLARLAIGPFVDAFLHGGLQSFFSHVAAPGYILSSVAKNGGETVRNMLAAVENDPAALLGLMEDDLSGAYGPEAGKRKPVIGSDGIHLLGEEWDTWLACPLGIDFGAVASGGSVYYAWPPRKSIEETVREALSGICGYRRERPDGRLVFRPFLGIDPGARGAAGTESTLYTYFAGFSRHLPSQLSAFKASAKWKGDPANAPRGSFAGIKLYPPLGFDPWPEDRAALDASRLMYGFCEAKGIPLVVHCDDQGYRTVQLDKAMYLTDPSRWQSVLEEFPGLVVNFAHFGERYLGRPGNRGSWTAAIVELMRRFPGVYADVAFNGSEPAYWTKLAGYLDSLPYTVSGLVKARLLFGTDFVISLTKTRSYLDYVMDFAEGPLDLELKRAMMSGNPARFLFDSKI